MAEISPSAFFNICIFFTDKEEKNERKNTNKKTKKKKQKKKFSTFECFGFFSLIRKKKIHTKKEENRKDKFSTFECCSLKRKKRMKEMILIVPLRKQALLNDYTCSYKVDNNTTVLKISMMI